MKHVRTRALVLLAAAMLAGTAQPASAASSTGPLNLYNVVTGKCADLPGYGLGTVGGPVNQYTCNYTSSDNQQWYFDPYDSGRFVIRNAKDGYCLDLPGYGSVGAGTAVSEYFCRSGDGDNQLWRASDRTGTRQYWLVNDKSGLCLDVAGVKTGGNDARLTVWPCQAPGVDDHTWSLFL